MDHITSYTYSRKNSFVTIGVLVILGVLFLSNVLKAYYSKDRADVVVFSILLSILVFMLLMVVLSRLVPALNNKVILEFTENEVIDYLRNITIEWKDIKSINFKRTRSSSMIVLQLKWESDYGSEIFISLRWIQGKDIIIYNTALTYFNKFSNQSPITEE